MGSDRPDKMSAPKFSVGQVVGHNVLAQKIEVLDARYARATTVPYIWDWHYLGKSEGINYQTWFRETELQKLN